MSVSTIGSGNSSVQNYYQQRKQDLTDAVSDVQSGDLASAQLAVAALQQTSQSAQAAGGVSGSQAVSSPQTSLASMLGAIQSGDLTDAQSDLTSLSQTLQTMSADGSADPFDQSLSNLLQAAQTDQGTGTQGTDAQGTGSAPVGGHHHHHGGGMKVSSSTDDSNSEDLFSTADPIDQASTDATSSDPLLALISSIETDDTAATSTTTGQPNLNQNLINS